MSFTHHFPPDAFRDAPPLDGSVPSPRVLRVEVLAGLVVALALIPEAISFSIIAGVDPRVGLYASFVMAVSISLTGGRPAMISAATGAMALVVVSLVADHWVEYLLAATVLVGLIQVVLGAVGAAKLMRASRIPTAPPPSTRSPARSSSPPIRSWSTGSTTRTTPRT